MSRNNAVPDGWRAVTLGDVATIRREIVDPLSNGDGRYVALEHIAQGYPRLLGWSSSDAATSTKTKFHAGDVLFGKLRPHLRKSVRVMFDGVCSTDILAIVAADGLDPTYLAVLCQSPHLQDFAISASIGTKMPRTTWQQLAAFRFPLPPLGEQQRIAGILASIDEAIERTETVIACATEVKQALAHELLTRGLPARHARFKQTPAGEIPACWEVVRLGDVARIQSGVAKNEKALRADPVVLPYLRVANVQDGYLDLRELKTIEIERGQLSRFQLLAGDVLFTEGGDADKLGRGAIWPGAISPCVHQNHVFAVRPGARLRPDFLALHARGDMARRYFLTAAKQTTNLASVNASQLGRLPVALPPLLEQDSIKAIIAASDGRIDGERAELERLGGLKERLADALLMGEVRVPLELPV